MGVARLLPPFGGGPRPSMKDLAQPRSQAALPTSLLFYEGPVKEANQCQAVGSQRMTFGSM